MSKPSVVFVITTVDGYGADKSVLSNIIWLHRKNAISPYVVIPRSGIIEYELKRFGIPYCVRPFRSWFTGPSWFFSKRIKARTKSLINHFLSNLLARKLHKLPPFDFVHTNTFTTDFGMRLAARLNAKHIMHLRELPGLQFNFSYEYSEAELFKIVDESCCVLFANSDFVKKSFSGAFSRNEIVVVPNPIETEEVATVRCFDFSNGFRLISAGRFQDDKRQMVALIACEILRDRGFQNFTLDLYGDGELKSSYEQFIFERNLVGIVKLHPYQRDLISILKQYHIGLITSRYEAFGRTAIEFMGSGIAVIGNETGNTPNIIIGDHTGLIAKFDDPVSYADKISTLLYNPEQIECLGRKAKELVSNTYSIESSSVKMFNEFVQRKCVK